MWTGRLPSERASYTTAFGDGTDNENNKETDLGEANKALLKELDRLQIENDMFRYMIYQPMRHASPKLKAQQQKTHSQKHTRLKLTCR